MDKLRQFQNSFTDGSNETLYMTRRKNLMNRNGSDIITKRKKISEIAKESNENRISFSETPKITPIKKKYYS